MLYKKTLLIAFMTFLFLLGYFAVATIIHDPLQIFHKPWGRKVSFVDNMRDSALGIIKHYDFDSVIVGNSMLENTSSKEASEKLGGSFINLSSGGMSYFERYKILQFALETKDIKNVILVFGSNFNIDKLASTSFSADSYSQNIFQQLKLYFNTRYGWCIATFSHSKRCIGRADDLDRPNQWMTSRRHLFGNYQNVINKMTAKEKADLLRGLQKAATNQMHTITGNKRKITKSLLTVDNYVLNLPAQYPETNFMIIIPPYSLLNWSEHFANLGSYEKIIEHAIKKAATLNNVKFYWFYDEDFVGDLSYYKDPTHYSDIVNSRFLDAIATGSHQLNTDNYVTKFKELEQKVREFDLKPYINMLQTMHKN